jgi:splicing factor 3A subunit 3
MLLEYLQDYIDRVKPLQYQNELFGKIQTNFEEKGIMAPFMDG